MSYDNTRDEMKNEMETDNISLDILHCLRGHSSSPFSHLFYSTLLYSKYFNLLCSPPLSCTLIFSPSLFSHLFPTVHVSPVDSSLFALSISHFLRPALCALHVVLTHVRTSGSPNTAMANELCMTKDALPTDFKFFQWATVSLTVCLSICL